ncbi:MULTISPECIES: DUF3667 domain-containing protein [Flavobacterium]|uniref:DUF3667 domain-containing protein n=1 Tax=Flavobacterium jumunjinense TaxID=998845 RepID=A0ABV5GMN2_9FLAO|nr:MULTISPECIES: DUF3667 domain-containing protein [Flavobacterium]
MEFKNYSKKCKNCLNDLSNNQKFCSECGGKVITKRITFKNLFEEILDKFFNIDNKFYQTFTKLFKQPQEVVEGYIDGMRTKYFNPIPYFAFSLTLAGFYYYLVQKGIIDYSELISFSNGSQGEMDQEITQKVNKFTLEYSNIITILFIPVYVLFSKILFSKYKDYNWAEHYVIIIYLFSQASIFTSIVILLSIFNTKLLLVTTSLSFVLQFLYFAYAFKKIFDLNFKKIFLRSVLFFVLLFIFILFIVLIGIGIGFYMKKNNLV